MLEGLCEWGAGQWEGFAKEFTLNFIRGDRWRYLWNGLGITLLVAFSAVLLGAFLGFVVALIRTGHERNGRLRFPNFLCNVYLTVIWGTPLVVQLLICYFVIFAALDNKVLVAVVAFGVNSGAYVAEIIRAGISSIDVGQMEAGRSLGLTYMGTMRHIILPQAIRNVLPALGNEFIVLLKETSVAGYIALQDLTKGGDIIRSQTYSAFMPYFAVAGIYLALVLLFTRLLAKLERKLRQDARN